MVQYHVRAICQKENKTWYERYKHRENNRRENNNHAYNVVDYCPMMCLVLHEIFHALVPELPRIPAMIFKCKVDDVINVYEY